MARYGRGAVEYVGLNDDGLAAARRFHERMRNPLLTDVSIDWGGLPVTDIYPKRIPDLFSAKPVMISGRYTASGQGTLRLRGKMAGHDFAREVRVDFPAAATSHDVLATLWARQRVDDLMGQDLAGAQQGAMRKDLQEQIVQLGLDYRLMTQFTSMVAVEEKAVTEGGEPLRMEVPVEMPEGVSYEGVFGDRSVLGRAALRLSERHGNRCHRGSYDAGESGAGSCPQLRCLDHRPVVLQPRHAHAGDLGQIVPAPQPHRFPRKRPLLEFTRFRRGERSALQLQALHGGG
jgi:hypothetical protein